MNLFVPISIRQLAISPRKIVGFLVVVLFVVVIFFGPTEAEMLQHEARWKAAVDSDRWLWSGAFFLATFLLVGLSVPVASGLMALSGFLFGRWCGLLVCYPACFLGATVAMLLSRYLFQCPFRRFAEHHPRFAKWVQLTDRGVERDGWYYLLFMRLTPIIPFFLINLLMGLTRIRIFTYAWVTGLGILPATCIFVNAGAAMAHIHSARDVVSSETLISLMLLVLIPTLLRWLVRRAPTTDEPRGNGVY